MASAKDSPPVIPGAQTADIGGTLWAVIGTLETLLARERTGKRGRVDACCVPVLTLAEVLVSQPIQCLTNLFNNFDHQL